MIGKNNTVCLEELHSELDLLDSTLKKKKVKTTTKNVPKNDESDSVSEGKMKMF